MPTETSPIYADPFDLRDGENVRPEESETEHERRVKQLAASIEADGQLYPIHIKEVDSPDGPLQIVVDGIGRRDAIRLINTKRKSGGAEQLLAWCVLNDGADTLKHAIVANFHRANNSPLEVAELIRKVRERYGWKNAPGKKGEGANGKLAEFFGILPSEITQYEKLTSAPPDIRERLADGTMSMSAALQLLKVTATEEDVETARDVRKKVVEKAREIATTEQRQKPPKPTTVPTSPISLESVRDKAIQELYAEGFSSAEIAKATWDDFTESTLYGRLLPDTVLSSLNDWQRAFAQASI